MKTEFRPEQLADRRIARANEILQTCVHCGMCTATCPSYQILGDELDSPRGRIYLIKSMLEEGRAPDAEFVGHIDRCLSCLACMTTCPSGVDYMHLIDDARNIIEEQYQRPLMDRGLRAILAKLIPYPRRFAMAMRAAMLARPMRGLFRGRLRAMLDLAPRALPRRDTIDAPQIHHATEKKYRVAILAGCAQSVLDPGINRAAIELLTRLGVEVVDSPAAGCCGALTQHMGKAERARAHAEQNVAAWLAVDAEAALDAIIVTTSGCGTTIKDYGHMLGTEGARRVSGLARDITEFLLGIYPDQAARPERVAYHAACSLQHGQKVTEAPKTLLRRAGFKVQTPLEGHLCCGSAGTYNLLQPEIARALGQRKSDNIAALDADIVAAGNIGCITQIGNYIDTPIVHTVELLNWAAGGTKPSALI